MAENTNPLNKYFRTPSIYVRLPSGGGYAPNIIEATQTGELGVMPMTAKDEIRFKTPDALLNGQGVVDVIQSCIPSVKDAWGIKSYDLDTLLIAVRIATYGETMDISYAVPGTALKGAHTVNLPSLLEQLSQTKIEKQIVLKDGLKINTKPLEYRDITKTSIETFNQQKMFASVSDSQVAPEVKSERFNEAFQALSELTQTLLKKNIESITTPDGVTVSDPAQINEFIQNANAVVINEITEKLTVLRQQGSVKPIKLKASEEEIKAGAPATYEVPVTFDTANFFV